MGDAQDKIEELIRAFDTILELCEDVSRLNEASENAVKEMFTVAAYLEKFYRESQQTGSIAAMQSHILDNWKRRGRNVPMELAVFEEACDLVLTACFRCQFLPGRSLCTAVQEYEHHCNYGRLQELVVHLLREGISCQLLHSIACDSPSLLSTVFVGWCNMIECGQSAKVKSLVVSNMQQNVALTRSILQLILKSDHTDVGTSLKSLLVDCIMTEMRALLDSLENLATGTELQCHRVEGCSVEYTWKDLGFPLSLVQRLCECEGFVGSRTLSWLSALQSSPGGSLWEDVAAYCGV